MRHFFSSLLLAVTLFAIVAIFISLNMWVYDVPRSCLLWSTGAFNAYFAGNFFAFVASGMIYLAYDVLHDILKNDF